MILCFCSNNLNSIVWDVWNKVLNTKVKMSNKGWSLPETKDYLLKEEKENKGIENKNFSYYFF